MICPNCSAELPDKSVFCGKCGKKLVFPSVNQTPKEHNTSNNQELIIQLDNTKSEANIVSEDNELVEPIAVSEQNEISEQKKTSEEDNKKPKIEEQDNKPKTAIKLSKNITPLNVPNDILDSQSQSSKQDIKIVLSKVANETRLIKFKGKDRRKKIIINIIAGLILVAVIAFIAVKALIPVYYRFTFYSIISNGNLADINNLIRDKKFIEYASDSQGQQALEFAATNIASSCLNEKYELMEETAFKKFENGNNFLVNILENQH